MTRLVPGNLRKSQTLEASGRPWKSRSRKVTNTGRLGLGKRWAGSFRQRLEGKVVRHGPEAVVDGATGRARRRRTWR